MEVLNSIWEAILTGNAFLNDLVWGGPMLVLLIGTGLFMTVRTHGLALKKLGYVLKNTLFKVFDKSNEGTGEISSFQAVSTALAATVGTGSIAGVATAIVSGGPGAVFWMWIASLVGMSTKYAEVVLSIKFREKSPEGHFLGGPMYYIKNGFKNKKFSVILGGLFATFGSIAALGTGAMVQSNAISGSLEQSFGFDPMYVGIIVCILVSLVILGGIQRVSTVATYLVPFMSLFYILAALVIVIMKITAVPHAFALIFQNAFSFRAVTGGAFGSAFMLALRYGIARGVFINEAGLGSAPIAHAAATTDHPARQGMWGIFEVFVTIIVCTMTALTIIIAGEWTSGVDGAALTVLSFSKILPGEHFGGLIVSIGGTLFAFSTILGWEFYGERCAEYLFGEKIRFIYRIIYIPLVLLGAIVSLKSVWAIADTFNGLMAIPNLIGLICLSGTVVKLTKDFKKNYMK